MDLEQLRTSKLLMYSSMEMAPYCIKKEECTREEAGNTSSDTGLRTADKVSATGEFGHQ